MANYTKNNIGFEVLPIIIKELVTMVTKKKTLPLADAFYYIYSSNLYQTLLDEKAKAWYLSTISLYELLEKEKAKERNKQEDGKVLLFKAFCIENFKEKENLSAEEVLFLFSKHGVFPFLEETFEMLHTQDKDYILDSVSKFIKSKKERNIVHKGCSNAETYHNF